ncbi:MAG: hypothetical protein HKN29_01285 [Rhodothermales bacterium]|nr:hypothetical protein [Rhodothermales bacterium]
MRVSKLLLLSAIVLLAACDSGISDEPDTIVATTILTSSSLAPQEAAPKLSATQTDIEVTPNNVTGEALSVLFPIDPAPDDGIVVFGDGRPDIAPTTATLFPFDFAQEVPIAANIQIKPTLQDGTTSRVNVLLGYADFSYNQLNGVGRTVRVALADVDGMVRGDKLLDMGGAQFQWFDLDTGAYTATRPANPATIPDIRDFSDPVRPNLEFFPLVANMTSTETIVAAEFINASAIDSEIDFNMLGAITLLGHNTSDLSEEDLIQAFTLTQIVNGLGGATGLEAEASITAVP